MDQVDPIFVSVKDAARILGVSTWLMYQRLDAQAIESRYEGRKRLVSYASLKAYAAAMPETQVKTEAAS